MAPGTGFVVDLPELDRILAREITERLDGADLNVAIPEVAGGEVQPGTEALARIFFERLEPLIPGEARLERVRVAESEGLAAEYGRGWPAPEAHG
jgi:6-pyruvoyl-tetrahydropterin synthase